MHTHTHIISYHMYKFLSDKQKVNKFELFLARQQQQPKKKKNDNGKQMRCLVRVFKQ